MKVTRGKNRIYRTRRRRRRRRRRRNKVVLKGVTFSIAGRSSTIFCLIAGISSDTNSAHVALNASSATYTQQQYPSDHDSITSYH